MKLRLVMILAFGIAFRSLTLAQSVQHPVSAKDVIVLEYNHFDCYFPKMGMFKIPSVKASEVLVADDSQGVSPQRWAFIQSHWQAVRLCETPELPEGGFNIAENPVPLLRAQVGGDTPIVEDLSFWEVVMLNWVAIVSSILGIFELAVRLTPTEKDNSIFSFIKKIIDFFLPNKNVAGGVHN
jgi:hypothetical protein